MKKTLSLLALGAFALAGCDFAGSTDSATAPIASIQAVNVPDADAQNVFIQVQDFSSRVYYRAPATSEDGALTIATPNGIEAPSASQRMYIVVVQEDESLPYGSRVLAMSSGFQASEVSASAEPLQVAAGATAWYSYPGCTSTATVACPSFTLSRSAE